MTNLLIGERGLTIGITPKQERYVCALANVCNDVRARMCGLAHARDSRSLGVRKRVRKGQQAGQGSAAALLVDSEASSSSLDATNHSGLWSPTGIT